MCVMVVLSGPKDMTRSYVVHNIASMTFEPSWPMMV